MNNVVIDETRESPLVKFNRRKGVITIQGKSTLTDPMHFYKNLLSEIDNYYHRPCPRTTLEFRLSYINTASSKWLLHILRSIDSLNNGDMPSTFIDWYHEYDDEAVQEAGEVYQSLIKIPFRLIPETY